MSDEQTRLLQQILETQKEQLAFTKQQHEIFLSLQNTAIAGQNKGLRMSRFVVWFMVIAVALLVVGSTLSNYQWANNPPDQRPARMSEE